MIPEEFMREAIDLSEKGMKTGRGGPFGAVVVKDGKLSIDTIPRADMLSLYPCI